MSYHSYFQYGQHVRPRPTVYQPRSWRRRWRQVFVLAFPLTIPIYETRNYVQRVLENAVVYDQLRPATARTRGSRTPLSWYLGKRNAG